MIYGYIPDHNLYIWDMHLTNPPQLHSLLGHSNHGFSLLGTSRDCRNQIIRCWSQSRGRWVQHTVPSDLRFLLEPQLLLESSAYECNGFFLPHDYNICGHSVLVDNAISVSSSSSWIMTIFTWFTRFFNHMSLSPNRWSLCGTLSLQSLRLLEVSTWLCYWES